MIKNNINIPTLKEIETDLFRMLQQSYSKVFQNFLTELDQQLSENRDKARFQLKDKRTMTMDSLFGSIEVKRNYYYDRKSEKYLCLLDQHLQFEGAKGLSPLVQDMAMELAVEGQSYRNASHTLEKLLGYSVISHDFHVTRDVRFIFKGHRRYRSICRKLAKYDINGFMVELNSAVGTLDDEKKEEALASLLQQLTKYPEALGDYREWLKEHGIDTTDMRPMGAAEGTMRVFAKRLKNGRSWSDEGIAAFIQFMVALKDELEIKTLVGTIRNRFKDCKKTEQLKYSIEKLKSSVGEATRRNVAYLEQATGQPVYRALKGLQGF